MFEGLKRLLKLPQPMDYNKMSFKEEEFARALGRYAVGTADSSIFDELTSEFGRPANWATITCSGNVNGGVHGMYEVGGDHCGNILEIAIRRNDKEFVRKLVADEFLDVNLPGSNGLTPIVTALGMVRELKTNSIHGIGQDANGEYVDIWDVFKIIVQSPRFERHALVQLSEGSSEHVPIIVAIRAWLGRYGMDREIIEMCLELGLIKDIDQDLYSDASGETIPGYNDDYLLHDACHKADPELVKYLVVEKGADPNRRQKSGNQIVPLYRALPTRSYNRNYFQERDEYPHSPAWQCVEILLENGADPFIAMGPSGRTLPHLAIINGYDAFAVRLLERYGKENGTDGSELMGIRPVPLEGYEMRCQHHYNFDDPTLTPMQAFRELQNHLPMLSTYLGVQTWLEFPCNAGAGLNYKILNLPDGSSLVQVTNDHSHEFQVMQLQGMQMDPESLSIIQSSQDKSQDKGKTGKANKK